MRRRWLVIAPPESLNTIRDGLAGLAGFAVCARAPDASRSAPGPAAKFRRVRVIVVPSSNCSGRVATVDPVAHAVVGADGRQEPRLTSVERLRREVAALERRRLVGAAEQLAADLGAQ